MPAGKPPLGGWKVGAGKPVAVIVNVPEEPTVNVVLLALVIAGAVPNVKRSFGVVALVPPPVVTVMSTVPAASAGETAVIWVGELTTTDAAGVEPKFTVAPARKLAPPIVTLVPPVVGPEDGDTLDTTGTDTACVVALTCADLADVPFAFVDWTAK